MKKHHPKNERIKHQYLAYLEEAKRMSVKSADVAAAAIADFEKSTSYKDFASFHIEQARRYKRVLSEAANSKTKRPLAKSTINARLLAVKAFFFWLAGQSGYKSRISYSDCDYFNPSANDNRIARACRERPSPDLEQIKHVLSRMADETDIEKRNRALIAFALLTGIRVDALASLKIKHVNLPAQSIFQDARDVRTKFRKTMITTFFPVGDEVKEIFSTWMGYLKTELLFGPDDPVFPATKVAQDGEGSFKAIGLDRKHWQSTGPIRSIFKQAFKSAGLAYYHPHSFKHTLARLGERFCTTPEEFKAWSQNLAHEKVLTTFSSYGKVSERRQADILTKMGNCDCEPEDGLTAETIKHVLNHLQTQNR